MLIAIEYVVVLILVVMPYALALTLELGATVWAGLVLGSVLLVLLLLPQARVFVDSPPILLKPRAVTGDSQRYGPNTPQVQLFLDHVHQLASEHWRFVGQVELGEDSIPILGLFMKKVDVRALSQCLFAHGLEDVMSRCVRETDDLVSEEHAGAEIASMNACAALVCRPYLSRDQFDAAYRPFERLIPLQALETRRS